LSIVFTDPSVYKGEGAAAEDLVVGIFRKNAAELPVELVRGTPILFRTVKVSHPELSLYESTDHEGNQVERESQRQHIYWKWIVGLLDGREHQVQRQRYSTWPTEGRG
jgi:hypothetical protein